MIFGKSNNYCYTKIESRNDSNMKKYVCKKCGKELDAGDKFCRYCGSNQIEVIDPQKINTPFEIKDGTLYKCNLKDPDCFSQLYYEMKFNNDHTLYEMISNIENKTKAYYHTTYEAYEVLHKTILDIPANVKKICNINEKYGSVFKGLTFYEVKFPKDIELEENVFKGCYIHKFTAPKSCTSLYGGSYGIFKISDFQDYKKPITLTECNIGKLIINSSVNRIVIGGPNNQLQARDINIGLGHIHELILNSTFINIEKTERPLWGGPNIDILNYPGPRKDIYKKEYLYLARKIICKDGVISERHIDGHVYIGDEYPSETKGTKVRLFATDYALKNSYHTVYYEGEYSGYININHHDRETSITIPNSITSFKIKRNDKDWVTIRKPYNGVWNVNVSELYK